LSAWSVFSVTAAQTTMWCVHDIVFNFNIFFLSLPTTTKKKPQVGVLLVILAQVFTATQFVVEEKFLGGYNLPPMQAVGLEGIFGVGILAIAMPIMYFGGGKPEDVSAVGNFFDIRFAFDMFLKYPEIAVSSIGCVISISLFNFFGLTITKVMSATSRSTIDAMRTLLVWICSLSFGWEMYVPALVRTSNKLILFSTALSANKSSVSSFSSLARSCTTRSSRCRTLSASTFTPAPRSLPSRRRNSTSTKRKTPPRAKAFSITKSTDRAALSKCTPTTFTTSRMIATAICKPEKKKPEKKLVC